MIEKNRHRIKHARQKKVVASSSIYLPRGEAAARRRNWREIELLASHHRNRWQSCQHALSTFAHHPARPPRTCTTNPGTDSPPAAHDAPHPLIGEWISRASHPSATPHLPPSPSLKTLYACYSPRSSLLFQIRVWGLCSLSAIWGFRPSPPPHDDVRLITSAH